MMEVTWGQAGRDHLARLPPGSCEIPFQCAAREACVGASINRLNYNLSENSDNSDACLDQLRAARYAIRNDPGYPGYPP